MTLVKRVKTKYANQLFMSLSKSDMRKTTLLTPKSNPTDKVAPGIFEASSYEL